MQPLSESLCGPEPFEKKCHRKEHQLPGLVDVRSSRQEGQVATRIFWCPTPVMFKTICIWDVWNWFWCIIYKDVQSYQQISNDVLPFLGLSLLLEIVGVASCWFEVELTHIRETTWIYSKAFQSFLAGLGWIVIIKFENQAMIWLKSIQMLCLPNRTPMPIGFMCGKLTYTLVDCYGNVGKIPYMDRRGCRVYLPIDTSTTSEACQVP